MNLPFKTILCILLLNITLNCRALTYGLFNYNSDGVFITITSYSGNSGNVTIPSTIDNLPVLQIGPSAFSNKYIQSIIIPDTVTNIADNCFMGCNLLESAYLGTNITRIGEFAFQSCYALRSISIPNGVKSIKRATFNSCWDLSSISWGDNVEHIGRYAFSGCQSLNTLNLPDSIITIDQYAFYICRGITSTTLPKHLETIGSGAFAWCDKLTQITIPQSLKSIGDSAFASCSSLQSMYFEGSPPAIGNDPISGSTPKIYHTPNSGDWAAIFPLVPIIAWNPIIEELTVTNDTLANVVNIRISGPAESKVVLEASSDVTSSPWNMLQIFTLVEESSSFIHIQGTNHNQGYYRLRMPR